MSTGTQMRALLRTEPYRFQIRGVRFLEERGGRAIIGDDMGLGKTLQAIAWLAIHRETRPVIVVCPSSVKYQWQRELWNHARLQSVVLSGQVPSFGDARQENIVIINYDILRFWGTELKGLAPKVLIIDECQRVKNPKAKRSAQTTELSTYTPHIIALSGTPILSRPIEFYPILHMIDPKGYPSRWQYGFRYCNPKRGFRGQGWDFSGASNTEELHQRVSSIMIRRMKTEVLTSLPAKTRSVVPIDITNRKEYEKAKADFIVWLASKKGSDAAIRAAKAEAVVKLGALKHLAAEGKMDQAVKSIQEWLEDTKYKLVVFAIHHSIIDRLVMEFPTAAVVTGRSKTSDRTKAVDRFQLDPKCRLFFGNIQAAGEGITLHAASDMMILEIGWTPAEHDQAEDRINRIGQKADHVHIRYLVAKDTIEEPILDLINTKREVVGRVIDGGRFWAVPMKIIEGLMKETKP